MNKNLLVGLVVLALLFGVFSSYNGLVALNENVENKWSQIDNQLQRRADLIPNLVNTVKGYAAHEKESIEAVANARAKLAGAQGPVAKSEANEELSGALSRLLMISENYPNLKADANFRALMDELAGTENRISVARKDYNDVTQVYNVKIRSLPTSLFAGSLGFSAKEYFKAAESSKQAPTVNFQ